MASDQLECLLLEPIVFLNSVWRCYYRFASCGFLVFLLVVFFVENNLIVEISTEASSCNVQAFMSLFQISFQVSVAALKDREGHGLLLWRKIYGLPPDFCDILVDVGFLSSLTVDGELAVEPLSSCTTVELLKLHVEGGGLPAVAISIHVVQSQVPLDLLCSRKPFLDAAEGISVL